MSKRWDNSKVRSLFSAPTCCPIVRLYSRGGQTDMVRSSYNKFMKGNVMVGSREMMKHRVNYRIFKLLQKLNTYFDAFVKGAY
jgi:hypothetical protein